MSTLMYLLDENISRKTYFRLKDASFSVKSVKTEHINGIKNGDLLVLCKENKWILVTHDKDFLVPSIPNFYGIIIVSIHPAIDEIAGEILCSFLQNVSDTEIVGKLIIIEKNAWQYKT